MTSRRPHVSATPSRSVPAGSRRVPAARRPSTPARSTARRPVRPHRPSRDRVAQGRVLAILLVVSLLFGLVVVRLAQLQLLGPDRYVALGESQRVRPVELPAERGSVFDRSGYDLALSVPQHTVWTDPRLVTDAPAAAAALAPVLGVDQAVLLTK